MMASAALISWPFVTLILFAALGAPRGLIWSVVVGYLFLPEGYNVFDMPVIKYNKPVVIAFSVLLAALIFHKKHDDDIHHVNPGVRKLMFLLLLVTVVISPIGTYLTNPEALVNGPRIRPGLSINDLLADMANMLIRLMPLILAARLLIRPEHHRELLIAILVMGVAYTFLVLFERRMSPQLNNWIYGYFPHNWLQHVRGGGFRPLVFLRHGLWLGFFLFTVFIAALALSRDKKVPFNVMLPFVALWVLLVIFLSRNLGPTLLAIMLAPVVFLPFRFHARLASALAIVILTYPALHELMEVPLNRFLDLVASMSADRAQSFQTRLENETELLARAFEKPLFGWGGWARMRIIDEFGRDISLVDGAWIVQMGRHGWVGYLGFFGLLAFPVFMTMRAAGRKPLTPAIAGMLVMMAGNFIYIIPNSTLNPIAMLMLGAMAAFAQYDVAGQGAAPKAEPARSKSRSGTRYTRFDHSSRAPAPVRGSKPHSRPVSMPYSSRKRDNSGA